MIYVLGETLHFNEEKTNKEDLDVKGLPKNKAGWTFKYYFFILLGIAVLIGGILVYNNSDKVKLFKIITNKDNNADKLKLLNIIKNAG